MPKKVANGKAKEWERERRERLNESFKELGTLLPCYDPSITRSKIEILQKAIAYITDLQKENIESASEKRDQTRKQICRLKLRVNSLLNRVQQLTALLKDASISIPPELPKDGQKVFAGRQPKWSNKFCQEDLSTLLKKIKKPVARKKLSSCKTNAVLKENLEKKECRGADHSGNAKLLLSPTSKRKQKFSADKTKTSYNSNGKKSKSEQISSSLCDASKSKVKSNSNKCSIAQVPVADVPICDSNVTVLTSTVPQVPRTYAVITSTVPSTSDNLYQQSSCIVLTSVSQPMPTCPSSQTSFIVKSGNLQTLKTTSLTLQPLLEVVPDVSSAADNVISIPTQKKASTVVVTNSHLLTAPIMATGIQACPAPAVLPTQGVGFADLCPGTLILTNGNLVPILSTPKPFSNSGDLSKCNSNLNQPSCIPPLPNNSILFMNKKGQNRLINSNKPPRKHRVYPLCLPKPLKENKSDLTKTTFVNVVPKVCVPRNYSFAYSTKGSPFPQNSGSKCSKKADNSKSNKNLSLNSTNSKGNGTGSVNRIRTNAKKGDVSIKDCTLPNSRKFVQKSTQNIAPVTVTSVNISSGTNKDGDTSSTLQMNENVLSQNHFSSVVEQTPGKHDFREATSDNSNKRKREHTESSDMLSEKRIKCYELNSEIAASHSLGVNSNSTTVTIPSSVSVDSDSHRKLAVSIPIESSPGDVNNDKSATITPIISSNIPISIPICTVTTTVANTAYAISSSTISTIDCLHSVTFTAAVTAATVDSNKFISNTPTVSAAMPTVDSSTFITNTTSSSLVNDASIATTNTKSTNDTCTETNFSSHPIIMSSSIPHSVSEISCSETNVASNSITVTSTYNPSEPIVTSTTDQVPTVGTSTFIVLSDLTGSLTSPTSTFIPGQNNNNPVCSFDSPSTTCISSSVSTSANTVCTTNVSTHDSFCHPFHSANTSVCTSSNNTSPITISNASYNVTVAENISVSSNVVIADSITTSVSTTSITIPNTPSCTSSTSILSPSAASFVTSGSTVYVPSKSSVAVAPNTLASKIENNILYRQKSMSYSFSPETLKSSSCHDKNALKGSENYSIACLCKSDVKNKCNYTVNADRGMSNVCEANENKCQQCKPLNSNGISEVSKDLKISNNMPSKPPPFSIKCVMESVQNKTQKIRSYSHLTSDLCPNINPVLTELSVKSKECSRTEGSVERNQNDPNILYTSRNDRVAQRDSNATFKTSPKTNENKSITSYPNKQNSQKVTSSNNFLVFDKKQDSSYTYTSSDTQNFHLQFTNSEGIPPDDISVSECFVTEPVPEDQNSQIPEHGLSCYALKDVSVTDKHPNRRKPSQTECASAKVLELCSYCEIGEKDSTTMANAERLKEVPQLHDTSIGKCVSSVLPPGPEYNILTPISVSNSIPSGDNSNKKNIDLVASVANNNPQAYNNEYSNDLFSTLHVPNSENHSESTSPTAAFLLSFPVVTTAKVSEIMGESQDVGNDSVQGSLFNMENDAVNNLDITTRTSTFQSPCKKGKHLPEASFSGDTTYMTLNSSQDFIGKRYLHLDTICKVNKDLDLPQIASAAKILDSDHFVKSQNRENDKNWTILPPVLHSQMSRKISNEENSKRHVNSQSLPIGDCNTNHQHSLGKTEKITKQYSDIYVGKEMSINNTHNENIFHNVISSITSNSVLSSYSENNYAIPTFNSKGHAAMSENHVKETSVLQNDLTSSIKSSFKGQSSGFISEFKDISEEHLPQSKTSLGNAELGTLPNNVNSYSQTVNIIESTSKPSFSKYSTNTSVAKNNSCLKPVSSNKLISSLNNADINLPVSTRCDYVINQTSENSKCSASFSVANSSSNFSILSWTTLSPMTTLSNRQQCNEFYSQNTRPSISQQNICTPSKMLSSQNCISETPVMPRSSEFLDLFNMQHKQSEQNTFTSNDTNKTQEPFPHSLMSNNIKNSSGNVLSISEYSNGCKRLQTETAQKNTSCQVSETSYQYSRHKTSQSDAHHLFPVNWISVPNITSQQQPSIPSHSTTSETFISQATPAIATVACKDVEFYSIGSSANVFTSSVSSSSLTFDTKTHTSNSLPSIVPAHNSHSNYYQNSSQSKEALVCFPNESISNKGHSKGITNFKRISDIQNSYSQANESYPVPWLQSKLSSSVLSNDVSNNIFVSSSLPTLVGDLALGTNFNVTTNDSVPKNKSLRPSAANEFSKKNHVNQNMTSGKLQEKLENTVDKKRYGHNKNGNVTKGSISDCSSQFSAGTFLSVSQLVDQANSTSGPSRDHATTHHSNLFIHHLESPNKQDTYQTQLCDTNSLSTGEMKQGNQIFNSPHHLQGQTQKDSNQHINSVNIKLTEDGRSLQHNNHLLENRKLQRNLDIGSSDYRSNILNPVPPIPTGNTNFSTNFNTQTTLSMPSNPTSWPTPSPITKQTSTKSGSVNCKASVSNYSAEALIGLNSINSTERVGSAVHNSIGSKVVTLPAPAVTERFSQSQFPPLPSVSQSLQVPPFSRDSILSNNYFPSVGLPSHSQDGSNNEKEQVNSWRNLTPHIYRDQQSYKNFNSLDIPSSLPSSTGQCSSDLLKHSKFIPSVGTTHSHHSLASRSLPCNFLPDLGSTNTFSGSILSESVNPFIFPPSSVSSSAMRSVCPSEKLTTNAHSEVHSSSSTFSGHGTQESSSLISSTVGDKNVNQTNSAYQCSSRSMSQRTDNSNSSHQLPSLGNISCNLPKQQRIRKRASDSVNPCSSSVGGLMDLAYLGVPPMIGSPMIADDGTYINHSSTFLTTGSPNAATPLYSGVPTASQGSFNSTPHCTGSTTNFISASRTNHSIANVSCSDHLNSRVPHSNATVSPNAVNSSSSSLTNFNLSTIFPEINEKVI